tara:strand:+ start:1651 stop:1863 length:213 start_codon:yes stop_codon:yes gene_type:complete
LFTALLIWCFVCAVLLSDGDSSLSLYSCKIILTGQQGTGYRVTGTGDRYKGRTCRSLEQGHRGTGAQKKS